MPNRIIKESICTSESVDSLSWFEEVFFERLIVNCDDFGRFDARPAILKSRLFPLKDRLTTKEISSALTKLADVGIVRLYECDSKPYLYLPTWEVHQNIRAKKSKYPSPDGSVNTSEIICEQMQANVPENPIRESESESNARETRAKRFTPPTLDEVTAYVRERNSRVDPQGFIDFYGSKGWMVGKTPMKDWKAACRNSEGWERWGKTVSFDTSFPTKSNAKTLEQLRQRMKKEDQE